MSHGILHGIHLMIIDWILYTGIKVAHMLYTMGYPRSAVYPMGYSVEDHGRDMLVYACTQFWRMMCMAA